MTVPVAVHHYGLSLPSGSIYMSDGGKVHCTFVVNLFAEDDTVCTAGCHIRCAATTSSVFGISLYSGYSGILVATGMFDVGPGWTYFDAEVWFNQGSRRIGPASITVIGIKR